VAHEPYGDDTSDTGHTRPHATPSKSDPRTYPRKRGRSSGNSTEVKFEDWETLDFTVRCSFSPECPATVIIKFKVTVNMPQHRRAKNATGRPSNRRRPKDCRADLWNKINRRVQNVIIKGRSYAPYQLTQVELERFEVMKTAKAKKKFVVDIYN
jgi:hypothetical protein